MPPKVRRKNPSFMLRGIALADRNSESSIHNHPTGGWREDMRWEEGDLEFETNDVIVVTKGGIGDERRWKGYVQGDKSRKGSFPPSYVLTAGVENRLVSERLARRPTAAEAAEKEKRRRYPHP